MRDVSEESLLDYFYSTGGNSGRVKNADILKTFKPFIGHSDLQLRAKYREEFKLIIDRIAVVKSENGEKYLVLKKKYRQMLYERDAKHHDGDGQSHLNPARPLATVQWDVTDTSTSSPHQKEQQDEPMACGEPNSAAEDQQTGTAFMQHTLLPPPVIQIQEPSAQSNRDDELDKDSGSKSESEQDEECTGSMGSTAVADFTSGTALHWAAKHGSGDMATLVANAGADVNTKSHGGYTPLHIAALHGHQHILDLLIGTYGAKENLRDYSGHLACHYLNIKEPEGPEEDCELQFQVTQARERNRNRKLVSLFHSKKKWGSAEELAPIEEERTASHQLALPAFRPRKFSR
ncbi:ankyrin repeat domain-containing protein SOWAHA isoform X7 [Siniperca chuatsi]|uniref:ankyrin repeat domain-containing protein SOWAHA isoform X7 n=1 Tax=Siniperca chuatsi TaxID=119488 RepID=UPI001CE0CFD4|nr:ankyrin repeat domain-containing protein SOWAHA isoform X7 [Siniperca chuatsi]